MGSTKVTPRSSLKVKFTMSQKLVRKKKKKKKIPRVNIKGHRVKAKGRKGQGQIRGPNKDSGGFTPTSGCFMIDIPSY